MNTDQTVKDHEYILKVIHNLLSKARFKQPVLKVKIVFARRDGFGSQFEF